MPVLRLDHGSLNAHESQATVDCGLLIMSHAHQGQGEVEAVMTKILVVDDSQDATFLLKRALPEEGYTV